MGTERMTKKQLPEFRKLRDEWDAALATKERRGTDADDAAEQAAWDALIDFVEENGLDYTEHDPRGIE